MVVNGAGSEVGKAAIAAIHKARGMQLAGAVDSIFQGKDAGEVMLLLCAVSFIIASVWQLRMSHRRAEPNHFSAA